VRNTILSTGRGAIFTSLKVSRQCLHVLLNGGKIELWNVKNLGVIKFSCMPVLNVRDCSRGKHVRSKAKEKNEKQFQKEYQYEVKGKEEKVNRFAAKSGRKFLSCEESRTDN
jgi:hypothetical protein